MNENGKIGLVLSGGSLTGIVAHTAVLAVIDELKIDIDYLVGTSAGAIVGGLYCNGISPYYFLNILKELRKKDVVSFSLKKFWKFGTIFNNKKLRRLIENELRTNTGWSLLEPKFACVAVNLSKGIKEVLKGGCKLSDAMLASAAIPFVFEPVKIGNDYYCDAGGISNVPIKEAMTTFPDIKTLIISTFFDWDVSDNVYNSSNPFSGNIFTKAFNVLNRYLKAGARELLALQSEDIMQIERIINIDLHSVYRLGLFNFKDIPITFQQAKAIAFGSLENF
ncbi:MAG: patatin-like phospholipase family protein [Candidatus Aenigmatarchaeota archaeon]